MFATLTPADLYAILVAGVGEPDDGATPDTFLDVPFADLGYDSLALMETAAAIVARTGVRIPDERIVELETPRAVLDQVNGAPQRAA